MSLKIVALSDTHNNHNDVEVPAGDILIFAGDLMTCGRKFNEIKSFAEWFMNQPHKYKILVAGNHDRLFESNIQQCLNEFSSRAGRYNTFIYLQDRATIIDGVKFWGSPYQPWFYDWAFNIHRGAPIKAHWDLIPKDTDVLITHGPPYGILDQFGPGNEHVGCEELTKAVERVEPKVHIFGHIHGGYGTITPLASWARKTNYHNVAICDEQYNPVNSPHVIEL